VVNPHQQKHQHHEIEKHSHVKEVITSSTDIEKAYDGADRRKILSNLKRLKVNKHIIQRENMCINQQ